MKLSLYIFLLFINAHSSALNRIFKYNSNNTTIGIGKEHITSCESEGKIGSDKKKSPFISETMQNILYLL
jgi:hypothetical protein